MEMDKFQLYVHGGIAEKKGGTKCYDTTLDIENADAFILQEKEVEGAQTHVFPSIEKAVQSLVCRYVDLVSCSENDLRKGEAGKP